MAAIPVSESIKRLQAMAARMLVRESDGGTRYALSSPYIAPNPFLGKTPTRVAFFDNMPPKSNKRYVLHDYINEENLLYLGSRNLPWARQSTFSQWIRQRQTVWSEKHGVNERRNSYVNYINYVEFDKSAIFRWIFFYTSISRTVQVSEQWFDVTKFNNYYQIQSSRAFFSTMRMDLAPLLARPPIVGTGTNRRYHIIGA